MPFDGTVNEANALVSLNRPSLRGLAFALRHPETWPAGFTWNYAKCNSCAMGLAAKIWTNMRMPPELEGYFPVRRSWIAREMAIARSRRHRRVFGDRVMCCGHI